jgi:hypothetical protein
MNSRQTILSIVGLGLILLALVVRSNLIPDYDAIAQDERIRSLESQIRRAKEDQERDQRWSKIEESTREKRSHSRMPLS